MRFIAVHLARNSGGETCCTFCCTPIAHSYVRDLESRLVYHHVYCMESHIAQSVLCIENAARNIS